jgi:mRNA interferase RelE/StbE
VTYAVRILRSAQRQLAKVDRETRSRIIFAVQGLAHDPRPHGSKKLTGRDAWRIRVGAYRVVYEIHDDHLVVLVRPLGVRRFIAAFEREWTRRVIRRGRRGRSPRGKSGDESPHSKAPPYSLMSSRTVIPEGIIGSTCS